MPAFFIVGSGRSGSTLLRAMLLGHPQIYVPGETGFIPRLLNLKRWWWREPSGFRAQRFLSLACANGRLERAGFERERFLLRLDESGPPARPEAAVGLMYEVLGNGEALVGDKTPLYVFHIRQLSSWFPEARFIHLVRDPRAVVPSLLNVPWGPTRVETAALHWRRAALAGIRGFDRLDDERRVTVRYEDLTEAPERVMRQLSAFLGVKFELAMLSPREHADLVLAEQKQPQTHVRIREGIVDRGAAIGLSEGAVEVIEAIAGDTMGRLGYSRSRSVTDRREYVRSLGIAYGLRAADAARTSGSRLARRSLTALRAVANSFRDVR